MVEEFEFEAAVFRWEGAAAWHFAALPEEVTDEIDERWGRSVGGFGAVPVEVTIGATTWRTSLFPDTGRGTFLLPVKKAVRAAEGLTDGSTARVRLVVRAS